MPRITNKQETSPHENEAKHQRNSRQTQGTRFVQTRFIDSLVSFETRSNEKPNAFEREAERVRTRSRTRSNEKPNVFKRETECVLLTSETCSNKLQMLSYSKRNTFERDPRLVCVVHCTCIYHNAIYIPYTGIVLYTGFVLHPEFTLNMHGQKFLWLYFNHAVCKIYGV